MRPCAVCGTPFLGRDHRAKYCGTVCKHRAATVAKRKHPLVPRACERCGATFTPKHPLWHRYCSDACRIRANKPRATIPARACGWCGKPYTPRNRAGVYCGQACYQAAKRANRQPEKPKATADTHPCRSCGRPIARGRRYCAPCQEHQAVQTAYAKAHGKGVLWVLSHHCPTCHKPTIEPTCCYACATGRTRVIVLPAERIKQAVAA